MNARGRIGRSGWHWRANAVVLAYLVAGGVASGLHALGHTSSWLVVHLFVLGAVTNAIVIWTAHFATSLVRPVPRSPIRLVLLNIAVIGVLVGVTERLNPLTLAAATVLTATLAAQGASVAAIGWTARGSRFAVLLAYYGIAATCAVCGVAAGAALAVGSLGVRYPRVFAAHVALVVFGWVALTVLGTLFALWPMVLHARVPENVQVAARHALVLCAGGLAVGVVGALVANRPLLVIGSAAYVGGVARTLVPSVRAAFGRPPHTAAAWMLAAAVDWLLVAAVADLVAAATSRDAGVLAVRLDAIVPWLLAGFVGQIVLGALSYLLPVVLGRGPAGSRRVGAILERAAAFRFVVFNGGVLLVALPLDPPATAAGWWLIAVGAAAFVTLAASVLFVTRDVLRAG